MSEDDLFAQAQAALSAKDRPLARQLLATLVAADPRHARAWLLLSTLAEDVDKSIECLQHVLALEPENGQARQWLSLALRARAERAEREATPPPEPEPEPAEPLEAPEPAELAEPEDPDAEFEPLEPEDVPVPRLGRYLLDFGFVSREQLEAALDRQRAASQTGSARPLGGILVDEGALAPDRLDFALREQQRVRAEAESLT